MGADSDGVVRVSGQRYFSGSRDFPDSWYDFANPVFGSGAGVPAPYALRYPLQGGDFAPNESDRELRRVLVAVTGRPPVRVPVEIAFAPADGSAALRVEGDVTDGRLTLLSTAAFDFAGRSPVGTWTVRLRTNATGAIYDPFYAGSTVVNGHRRLDLSWLTDIFLLLDYGAKRVLLTSWG
jgi:hypothetical protein